MIHSIHHLSIATPDIEIAARDYAVLLAREPDGAIEADGTRQVWFSTTNVRLALVEPSGAGARGEAARRRLDDKGEGLWEIVFGVDDIARATTLFERRGLAPGEEYAHAIAAQDAPSALRASRLSAAATHGIDVVVAQAARNASVAPAEAGVAGLDHVVVRTPDPERAVALYGARLGLDMRLDRTNPAWGARLLFFRCGDLVVEIAHALKDSASGRPTGSAACRGVRRISLRRASACLRQGAMSRTCGSAAAPARTSARSATERRIRRRSCSASTPERREER